MKNLELNIVRRAFMVLVGGLCVLPLTIDAATIKVNIQIGGTGCDLVDAINSANNDFAEGGCEAVGTFGAPDLIQLSSARADQTFTVSQALNPADPNNDETAFPFIQSNIIIEGLSDNGQLINIIRDAGPLIPDFRFFKVVDGGSLTLKNVSLQNGRLLPGVDEPLGAVGGAIRLNPNAELNLENCEIKNNTARGGGAIEAERLSKVTIRRCSIVNNNAIAKRFTPGGNSYIGGSGGAMKFKEGGTLLVFDSTISNNFAGFGGAVNLTGPNMTANIYNTTISNNLSSNRNTVIDDGPDSGGGIRFIKSVVDPGDRNSLTIVNSIISGNTFPRESFEDYGYELGAGNRLPGENQLSTTLINNVIGYSGQSKSSALSLSRFSDELGYTGSGNIFLGSDQAMSIPLPQIISPLAQNGGPTQTHALPLDSPAIDAAIDGVAVDSFFFKFYLPGCRGEAIGAITPLPRFRHDQRGVARPVGGACDIGSYEWQLDEVQCYTVKAENNNVITFCL